MKRSASIAFVFSTLVALSGCSLVHDQQYVEWETKTPDTFPVLTATGFAPIDAQPGETPQHKDLAAMRASKLEAYRELAEQVYGQRISAIPQCKTGRWATTNFKHRLMVLSAELRSYEPTQ